MFQIKHLTQISLDKHIPLPLKCTHSFLYEALPLLYSLDKEHRNTLNIKPSSKTQRFLVIKDNAETEVHFC